MRADSQNQRQKNANKRLLMAMLAVMFLACTGMFLLLHRKMQKMQYPMQYSRYVTYYADKYGTDPFLLYAFIRTESGFSEKAQSEVDARGLMQITEITFDWIKSNIAPDEPLTFDDMYDPETNIRFGCYFVSYCLLRYGDDVATAAAAYHNGWGTVDSLLEDARYSSDGVTLKEFPYPMMKQYVKKITGSYAAYKKLYAE